MSRQLRDASGRVYEEGRPGQWTQVIRMGFGPTVLGPHGTFTHRTSLADPTVAAHSTAGEPLFEISDNPLARMGGARAYPGAGGGSLFPTPPLRKMG